MFGVFTLMNFGYSFALQEDVDAFMVKMDSLSPVDVIKRFDELRMKYKFMEQNLLSKKNKLNVQVPDIQSNLEALRFLQEKNVCFVLYNCLILVFLLN